jgi:chemotaxis signal transduction protein
MRRSVEARRHVGFRVGAVEYALLIDHVVQVVRPMPIIEAPTTAAEAIGLARFRDDIIPVVDLRIRFHAPAGTSSMWLIIRSGSDLAALVVDVVTAVFGTPREERRAAPPAAGEALGCEVLGVIARGGVHVLLIDLRGLVQVAHGKARLAPSASKPLPGASERS